MPKEAKNKTKNNNKKDSKNYFKEFKAELKKVVWPTPKQLVNSTVAVLTIIGIVGVIVFVLNGAFNAMNEFGVEKLKSYVESSQAAKEDTAEDTTTNDENNSDENTADTVDGEESTETLENTENNSEEVAE